MLLAAVHCPRLTSRHSRIPATSNNTPTAPPRIVHRHQPKGPPADSTLPDSFGPRLLFTIRGFGAIALLHRQQLYLLRPAITA